MNSSLTDIVQLRNNINFASISQFFHTFQSAFRPWPVTTHDIIYARNLETNEYVFETEDLERMILDPSERIRFEDLLVRMLRLVSGKRFINASTWQTHFAKEFDKRQLEEVNPFYTTVQAENQEPVIEAVNYFTLSLDTRIYLLYLLCEWQLDEPEKFREHLDGEEDAVQWRVDPIGFDKKGSTFWLFDDNRLYKETPKPKPSKKKKPIKKKPAPSGRRSSRRNQPPTEETDMEESEDEGEWMPWKLLCCTKYEWEQFPLKYAHSKHVDEQRFYTLLVNDLLPKIIPVMEEHEREIKKQEAIMHRKRSSRIMIKELEALERSSSHEPEIDQVGKGRTSNRIEKKTLEKEQEQVELAAKAREERLLERERRIAEREYRALAREKKQESEDPVALVEEHVASPILSIKMTVNDKPKRKYVKKDKFDKDGNPIPRKVKLDKDGNPIPLKKRGRKPKNKNLDEENWVFDCICGVSGKNLDDGTPMIACEKCGVWQHIKCLQKSGQIEKRKNMDDIAFVCRPCENQQVNIDDDEPQSKRFKVDNVQPMDYQQPPLTPQNLMQTPQQQPIVSWQQPSAVRGPYYPPVLPPIRTPSLSSIHNLINNITAPPRTPPTPSSTTVEPPSPSTTIVEPPSPSSTIVEPPTPSFPVGGLSAPSSNLEVSSPSSVIVEPPTPPIAHQKVNSQQAPTSKLSEPINDHKHVQVAPISQQPVGITQQAPLPVLIDSQQPSPFIQAPVSTVRGPTQAQLQIANPPLLSQVPPTVTAPPTEAVQVTANTPVVPLPPQPNL